MFNDLSSAHMISVDIETRDTSLSLGLGPGEQRPGNYICGVALATDDGFRCYYPVAHEQGTNLDKQTVYRYLSEQLGREHQPKLGANIKYDVQYLTKELVTVRGKLYDIALAESLLDENRGPKGYSLNAIAQKYLNQGKDEELLYGYLAKTFGGQPTRTQQAKNIWRAPSEIVEDYALGDVLLPLEIYKKQRFLLQQENLTELFDMETDLIWVLIHMRFRGIRIDENRVTQLQTEYTEKKAALEKEIKTLVGKDFNLRSGKQIGNYFSSQGIMGEQTKKGAFKTDKEALGRIDHPAASKLVELRGIDKLLSTYLNGYLSKHAVKGRIHCQLHNYVSEEGGAVTGRMSSSDPNLQNLPKRHGTLIRSCFLPEQGELWSCKDYSQIEPRVMAHFARGPLAEELRRAYRENPATDFYTYAQEMIKERTGRELTRGHVKTISLGLMYGMGRAKLTTELGTSEAEAMVFFDAYKTAFPFVSELSNRVAARAAQKGYVKTLLGRRRRFDLWESANFGEHTAALTHDEALTQYGVNGGIKRSGTYKAFNFLCQGNSADILKIMLLQVFKSGVCDIVGAPLMVVHDDSSFSIPQTKEGLEADREIGHIMETAVKLSVPLKISSAMGANWGDLKDE